MTTRRATIALAALAALLGACARDRTPLAPDPYVGTPPLGTPLAFPPADELDVDGDGAGDGWWWIPFDGSSGAEELAVCGDGTSTGLAVSPGTSRDLLVFFDGGGACWSLETCVLGAAVDARFDAAMFKAEARDFIPCSITSRPLLPPSLAGATIVFVPYCTGDVHGGNREAVYGKYTAIRERWAHRGHANVMAYLRRLAATWPIVDRLVVAGSSAGGFGALVNYPAFRWYWPEARGHLLDDSGPALVANDVPADFRNAWFLSWWLGVSTDPFCPGCRSDLSAAFAELSDRFPADRLAFLSHARDDVMGAFLLFATGAGFEEGLGRLERTVLRPTPNARAFIDAGSDHMLLTPVSACAGGSYVASHLVGFTNPVSLPAWLEQMLSGDPAWDSRVE